MKQTQKNSAVAILKKWAEYLFPLVFYLFFAALYFKYGRVHGTLYSLFIGVYLFDYLFFKRYKSFKWGKEKLFYLVPILYFLLILIRHLFEASSFRFDYYVGMYAPFFLFGAVGFLGFSDKIKLKTFAAAELVVAVLFVFIVIIFGCGVPHFFAHIAHPMRVFQEGRMAIFGPHIAFDTSLSVAFALGIYLFYNIEKKYQKVLVLVGLLVVYYALFISDGRVGYLLGNLLFAVFLLSLVYSLLNKYTPKYIRIGAMVLFALVAVCGACYISLNHSRGGDRIKQDPRFQIWETCYRVGIERPIFGWGVSDGRIRFTQVGAQNPHLVWWHNQRTDNEPINEKTFYAKHEHNVFLQAWLAVGILGVLLMLALFIFPLFLVDRKMLFYLIVLVGVMGISALFDIFGTMVYLAHYMFPMLLILGNKE